MREPRHYIRTELDNIFNTFLVRLPHYEKTFLKDFIKTRVVKFDYLLDESSRGINRKSPTINMTMKSSLLRVDKAK